MEREILFRGKVADEPDEWVIGSLFYKGGNDYSIFQREEHEKSKCCGVGSFGVKPETIGQYLGLKDCNGKMIFEGDILKSKHCIYNYYIKYEDCAYSMRTKWGNGLRMAQDVMNRQQVEIIGNIKDNPELLKY